ncbi:EscU/YscU/HrcU family type III secretion system export apparatus switch protein [Thiomicrospira sp. R3]|uniref:EscU/YscU/HrcU family type III secretion system export apparatus switch protein n=1 Tax=Thiomicrospira sp. R3 TaxID=3035472 RepID=UPI00259BEC57|nr:EscU/YscU/HrcU family type III secretion system export apparatus switch protein [Thiomicrospira sp. R3]WFE68835.1 EscU/YscU/HrcU family type III secretion system export apparatus switch protein [Thiomicrospira sp. R3]
MPRLVDKVAVSLEYNGDSAPRVSAKGSGLIAQQIIELAKQHNIPIKQDPELSALLSQVELNQEIPPVLYEAIVQVLVFAYQVSGKPLPKP